MKRIARILVFSLVLTTLLVVSIAGTVFAANGPNPDCEPIGDGPFGPSEGTNGPHGPNPDCEPIGDGPFGPSASNS